MRDWQKQTDENGHSDGAPDDSWRGREPERQREGQGDARDADERPSTKSSEGHLAGSRDRPQPQPGGPGWIDAAGPPPNHRNDGSVPRRMMEERMDRGYRSPAEREEPRDGSWHARDREGRALGDHGWRSASNGGAPESADRAGKPPKGYVRSDERLVEEICERLASQRHDWSDVEVRVSGGEVTLTGTVADRQQKYEAERVADSVRGVLDIHNQIRTKPRS